MKYFKLPGQNTNSGKRTFSIFVHVREPSRASKCASRALLFVNLILRGQCAVESCIFAPCACDVTEIALPAALTGNADAAGKGFNRHFIQAFALGVGCLAKSFVQGVRYVANGVLHTFVLESVGMKFKQYVGRLMLQHSGFCRRKVLHGGCATVQDDIDNTLI
jgi:hypothetical protein